MGFVKSLSVGEGDMFYINHASDNFSIIDCCLTDNNRSRLVKELKNEANGKGITRFISTHPDEDHIGQLEYLDSQLPIVNFYCVKNAATKEDPSTSFEHYCSLRDGSKAYYVEKGCQRKWMNLADDERGAAGLHVLWPVLSNVHFKDALEKARKGESFNNMSIILQYLAASKARMLWLGDLETDFMDAVTNEVELTKTHIVFAPHHGRKTGKIPNSWLDKLEPNIIVVGEAPSRHLYHYKGYRTLRQNGGGDFIFDCDDADKVHIYASEPKYKVDFLTDEKQAKYQHYIGTLNIK